MTELLLLKLEDTPVYQNKMYTSAQAARDCPRGVIELSQNSETGLIRNIAFNPSLLTYDGSYQNEQGVSTFFQQHIDDVLTIVKLHFNDMRILEVGCGKGAFLESLRSAGFDAYGIDPSYEGVSEYVIREEFSADLGLQGEAIVMRHVLEHIPDPVHFLQEIRVSNGGKGLIYIEVPCFEWILTNNAWFDVFYEHVNYFRISDFNRIFGRILASGHIFGGQYLYVVADLESLRDPGGLTLSTPSVSEIPVNFYGGINRCINLARQNSTKAIWGAAAKGVTFLHQTRDKGLNIDIAIDINPAKQGHYLAGSGLQVYSPSDAKEKIKLESDIFVMNSNYLDEIKDEWGLDAQYITVDKT